jgi:hypothetical protein
MGPSARAGRHGERAADAEHSGQREDGNKARSTRSGEQCEPARAGNLQRAAAKQDLAAVVAVGRLAGEQHQREHWQELCEPDHADEE